MPVQLDNVPAHMCEYAVCLIIHAEASQRHED